MDKPFPNVKVVVDDRFHGKIGSGGEFLVSNVPKGDHMLLVKTLTDEPLYGSPFPVRDTDNGKVLDMNIISVSDAVPSGSQQIPDISTTNVLYEPSETQAVYPVGLMHIAKVIQKPNVFEDGVWKDGLWNVNIWVNASPQILSQIERVTYYLHPTFRPSVVTRESSDDNFALSLTAWGQFEIKAKAYFKDGQVKDLSRKLGFPLS
jgi:hypothetical protein